MIKQTLFLMLLVKVINAANILVVAPTPNVGQWLYIEEFIRDLLIKGHSVTGISSYNARRKNPQFTEIIVPAFNKQKDYPSKDVYGGIYWSEYKILSMQWDLGLKITDFTLRNPKVMDLIRDRSKTFDLVIVDHSNMEAFFMFSRLYKCPLVTISPSGYTHALDSSMGLNTPSSFISHVNLPYSENMSFFQRVYNSYFATYESFMRKVSYIPAQNKLAQKYFKDFVEGQLPNLADVEKEISLMLVNHHRSFDKPRVSISRQIDIGGAHIRRPVINFPNDIKNFLDTAENGVIVVSFGSYFKFHEMPQVKLNEFMEAFRALKQRIILKSDIVFPTQPPNVMVLKWLAQSDILAHPKVVLFINYGETLSMQEAVSRGVPVLIIPFFNHDLKIAYQIHKLGLGLYINFDDVSRSALLSRINSVTATPQIKENALRASKLFNDYQIHPMSEAIFWIEYVIRNNGAKHLKSPSINLAWTTYMMYDVALFYFGFFSTFSILSVLAWRYGMNRYRSREQKGKFKYY